MVSSAYSQRKRQQSSSPVWVGARRVAGLRPRRSGDFRFVRLPAVWVTTYNRPFGRPTLWRARCPGRAEGARPEECRWADRAEAGGGRFEEGANGRLGHPWQALVQVRSVPATAMARPRQSRTHAAERGEIVRRVLTFALRFPLTTPSTKQPHVFRLHRSRVYYVRESLLRQAISVPRANLISLGVCLGKFSKTEKFRLHVTALDLMGKYAKNKVRSFSRVACL